MKTALITAAAVALLATPLLAQDRAIQNAVKARQGQFQIMAINLGILGSMARGNTDYDAEAAQAAADSLVAISGVNPAPLWPEGSDSFSIDGTRAEPAIWENLPDVVSKWGDFGAAAVQLQAVAANGQAELGPMLGMIGGTCKACHDDYRTPQ